MESVIGFLTVPPYSFIQDTRNLHPHYVGRWWLWSVHHPFKSWEAPRLLIGMNSLIWTITHQSGKVWPEKKETVRASFSLVVSGGPWQDSLGDLQQRQALGLHSWKRNALGNESNAFLSLSSPWIPETPSKCLL